MKRARFAIFLMLLAAPSVVLAWGPIGHRGAFDNMPLIKLRLLEAGVRLAGLLNSIFSQPGPSIPDRVPVQPPG